MNETSYVYDPSEFPAEIADYFSAKFPADLQRIKGEVCTASFEEFQWQLDCPFWKTEKGCSYNLAPSTVLAEPGRYAGHFDRILNADLNFPLIASRFGGRLVILDGLHRLAKCQLQGVTTLKYIDLPRERLGLRSVQAKIS